MAASLAENGISFIIAVGAAPDVVAGATTGTLTINNPAIDTTTKDSVGWKENIASSADWTVESDGVVTDETDTEFVELQTSITTGVIIAIEITTPGLVVYTGSALVTTFTENGNNDEAFSYSFSCTGTGALTITPPA